MAVSGSFQALADSSDPWTENGSRMQHQCVDGPQTHLGHAGEHSHAVPVLAYGYSVEVLVASSVHTKNNMGAEKTCDLCNTDSKIGVSKPRFKVIAKSQLRDRAHLRLESSLASDLVLLCCQRRASTGKDVSIGLVV